MLNHIVSILILDKTVNVIMKFFEYWRCLFRITVFQDPLNDTAAIRVCGKGNNLEM